MTYRIASFKRSQTYKMVDNVDRVFEEMTRLKLQSLTTLSTTGDEVYLLFFFFGLVIVYKNGLTRSALNGLIKV